MNSVYIDLAIGMALAFFLLSLVASGLNELMVRVLGVRAKFLWATVRDLLDKPHTADGQPASRTPNGVLDIVSFALLKDYRPEFQESAVVTPTSADTDPDGAEASGLDDLTNLIHERLSNIGFASRKLTRPTSARKTTLSQVPPERFALALVEVVDGKYDGNIQDLIDDLKASGSPFAGLLQAVVAEAQDDREQTRQAIEKWFESEMTRLTAVYRRHTRWVIAGLAVVMTLLVGFDSVNYASRLTGDQAKREQLVAASTSGELEQLDDMCSREDPDQQEVNVADCFTSVIGHPALSDSFTTAIVTLDTQGDETHVAENLDVWWNQVSNPDHWLGMLLTMVALTFGAPFWWEALRRLMGMRTRRPIATTSG